MDDKGISYWMITGAKWYVFIVLGGIFSLGKSIGWLFHDVWYSMRGVGHKEEYLIDKSPSKLCIAAAILLLSIISHIMTIMLIFPILLGLQHLMRRKPQGLEMQTESDDQAVKEVNLWYDGIVYAAGIDPIAKKGRERIGIYIEKNSEVIDVCCGTGALVFDIAEGCNHVTGVDHSVGMINYANKEKVNKGLTNVTFVHADAGNLSLYQDHIFDYAIISMAIHEMPQAIRLPVLREASRIAKEVFIADYMIPMPINKSGMIFQYLEYSAGYDHLRNFLNFRDNGGLDDLLEKAGLIIEEDITEYQGTIRIVRTRKATT